MLKNSDFNVYLMESVYTNKYYIMLGMSEEKLAKACSENKVLFF